MTHSDKENGISYEAAFQKLAQFINTTHVPNNQKTDCTEQEKSNTKACQHCATPCK